MHITIHLVNINDYRFDTFPEIEDIRWRLGYLDREVLKNFPNLKILNCSDSKLTSLQGLEDCTRLQKLNCFDNKLTDLRGLEHCTQLRKLYCSNNQLTSLQGLEHCTQLQKFCCSNNKLTSLQELTNCAQLRELYCSHNKLTNLQGLEKLTQLRELYCSRNQITNLLPIVYLTQLNYAIKYGNPLDPPTIQEERFLARLQNRRIATIYSDKQNVHNTAIQKSVLNSTTNLLKDPKPPKPDITQLSNQSQALLQTYLSDPTPHSVLLITYEELFSYVWQRINQSEHKDTLIQIFEQELKDSTDLCYTGRFNRTINTLSGFYDDIEVQISDPDRINAIIAQHKNKDRITQALQEAGYDQQTINDWTEDL